MNVKYKELTDHFEFDREGVNISHYKMGGSGFFITLLSNSSMTHYPDNTTASFIVTLPQNISLPGSWCVGVAEVHYNYNFFNISHNNNKVIIKLQPDRIEHENAIVKLITHYCEITPGFYTSMNDVIGAINSEIKTMCKIENEIFVFDRTTLRCKVQLGSLKHKIVNITLQGRLSTQLGFEPNANVAKSIISPHCCNIHYGVPDQMFIYTDIIEPTCIGHEKAYVIKIVNTQPKNLIFGDPCCTIFEPIHYMPLQKREFNTISIDIRHHSGDLMPFQHGVFTIKLHFKKS